MKIAIFTARTYIHTHTENYTPYIGRKGVTRQDKGKERKGKGRGEQILFVTTGFAL